MGSDELLKTFFSHNRDCRFSSLRCIKKTVFTRGMITAQKLCHSGENTIYYIVPLFVLEISCVKFCNTVFSLYTVFLKLNLETDRNHFFSECSISFTEWHYSEAANSHAQNKVILQSYTVLQMSLFLSGQDMIKETEICMTIVAGVLFS